MLGCTLRKMSTARYSPSVTTRAWSGRSSAREMNLDGRRLESRATSAR
uniref:Uncharacterized protein n=1 Tax=Arundo donax TaxID=35708 RepID=A0A0A8YEW7_ARUDO